MFLDSFLERLATRFRFFFKSLCKFYFACRYTDMTAAANYEITPWDSPLASNQNVAYATASSSLRLGRSL